MQIFALGYSCKYLENGILWLLVSSTECLLLNIVQKVGRQAFRKVRMQWFQVVSDIINLET